MQAVAKPSPGALLDMLHHHAPVWQAFALLRLDEGCGLQPAQEVQGCPTEGSWVRCPMPLSVVALPQSLNARDWWESVCFLVFEGVSGSYRTFAIPD